MGYHMALNISYMRVSSQWAPAFGRPFLYIVPQFLRCTLKSLFLHVASVATVFKIKFSLHLFKELRSFLLFSREQFVNVFSLLYLFCLPTRRSTLRMQTYLSVLFTVVSTSMLLRRGPTTHTDTKKRLLDSPLLFQNCQGHPISHKGLLMNMCLNRYGSTDLTRKMPVTKRI